MAASKLTEEQAKALVETDEDFVALPRFDNSLKKLLERYPDGVPERTIAQGLMLTEEEVERRYGEIVLKLRQKMKVEAP